VLRIARTEGAHTRLHKRASIERLLAIEMANEMDVGTLKSLLRQVVQGETPEKVKLAALAVEELTAKWLPMIAEGTVMVSVSGWPPWVSPTVRNQIVGFDSSGATQSVREAAATVHHLNGYELGGHILSVDVSVLGNQTLPPVHRKDRGRNRKHQTQPWLPHSDEQGRYSATPRHLAEYHGSLFSSVEHVFDPFCGIGGDTIGIAMTGTKVWASDHDKDRLGLARENARQFGVEEAIQYRHADANTVFSQTLPDSYGLFLDPPWDGPNWDPQSMKLSDWMKAWPFLRFAMEAAQVVVIKLPRRFDVSALPGIGRPWTLSLGLGLPEDNAADRVRLITAHTAKTKH